MGDGGRRRRSRLRRSRQRRHGGASVMGVSAAEEAGPDETPDAKEGRGATSDTQGREERRGCERACRDGAAHVLYYRMGHLGRKLSDHLREAAGRVHLGRLARAILELVKPQCALAGSASEMIGGRRDELELRIVREPRQVE